MALHEVPTAATSRKPAQFRHLIDDLAAYTPFEMNELVETIQTLLAVAIGRTPARDRIEKTLRTAVAVRMRSERRAFAKWRASTRWALPMADQLDAAAAAPAAQNDNPPPDFWSLVADHEAIEAIPNDQATDADFDRAGELLCAIMATPAPDAAALRWKLNYAFAMGHAPDDLVFIRTDMDRFLPAAGAA
jgi:hypothetical protein